MKLSINDEGRLRRRSGALCCPFHTYGANCGVWCPFCEIDEHQVTLHCTGTKVVFELEKEKV